MSYIFYMTRTCFHAIFSGWQGGWFCLAILAIGTILTFEKSCRPVLKKVVLPISALLWLVCEAIVDLYCAEVIVYDQNFHLLASDVGSFCLMLSLGIVLGGLAILFCPQKSGK